MHTIDFKEKIIIHRMSSRFAKHLLIKTPTIFEYKKKLKSLELRHFV